MRVKSRWLALLLVLGLVLAACGGDSGTEDDGDTTTTTASGGDSETTTTTAAGGDDSTTTTAADEPMVATDFGVDLEAGVIRIGMLSDLSSPFFGALVTAILAGYEAYINDYNANGGLDGLQIELVVRDTLYSVDNHVQLYNEIKDQVVMIGHSTGSPHTVAINADLQADSMLTIPLTWYSGWSDPAINAALLSHGTPYCLEAQNMIGYILEEANPEATTIAIAGFPGDYGQDSAAGAKIAAEALGLEVVFDGEGQVIPSVEAAATWAEVAAGIAEADPDIVWLATNGDIYGSIFSQARDAGMDVTGAIWSGPSPSWSPALIAPDNPNKDDIAAAFIGHTYNEGWSEDNPFLSLFQDAGLQPSDYYTEGVVEAMMAIAALEAAYENGDMTRAGVLAAAKSLDTVEFDGAAPAESYTGEPNERLQRQGYIYVPDPEGLASGTNGGRTDLEKMYTSQIAADYEFTGACYVLEG